MGQVQIISSLCVLEIVTFYRHCLYVFLSLCLYSSLIPCKLCTCQNNLKNSFFRTWNQQIVKILEELWMADKVGLVGLAGHVLDSHLRISGTELFTKNSRNLDMPQAEQTAKVAGESLGSIQKQILIIETHMVMKDHHFFKET